jgi:hypothetical protein
LRNEFISKPALKVYNTTVPTHLTLVIGCRLRASLREKSTACPHGRQ